MNREHFLGVDEAMEKRGQTAREQNIERVKRIYNVAIAQTLERESISRGHGIARSQAIELLDMDNIVLRIMLEMRASRPEAIEYLRIVELSQVNP